jgi:outer membrane protein OmpA-like peptidoglycan-associated protein
MFTPLPLGPSGSKFIKKTTCLFRETTVTADGNCQSFAWNFTARTFGRTLTLTALVSLLFTASPGLSQTDSTAQKTKKGGGLGKFLKDAAKDAIQTATGLPMGNGNASTGSSGATKSSGGVFSVSGNTIKGEWKEYGGGGGDFSPRDHYYTFAVTENNAEVRFEINSGIPNTRGYIFSPSGERTHTIYGHLNAKFQRTGTYRLLVASGERYAIGSYELKFQGPLHNLQMQKYAFWSQKSDSFGEEGGSTNDRAPRSHHYTFEPEPDQYFDVNVESDGIPIRVVIFDPTGGRSVGYYNGSSGIDFILRKAQQKGKYQIWVGPAEHNGKGSYKLEVAGNLKQNPVRVPSNHQVVKTRFSPASRRHEYTIPAKAGNMEMIYRSTNTAAQFKVYDAYNQLVGYSQNGESQLSESYIPVKQAGNLKVVVETQQPEVGEYELLVWGYFDKISGKNVQTPAATAQKQRIPDYQTTSQSTGAVTEEPHGNTANVTLTGRIRSKQPNVVYTDMHVVFEDLETGEKVGDVAPDATGTYTFEVPPGRHYSITVLSPEGYIASSQNVNLVTKTSRSPKTTVGDITVIAGEVGEVINLNNIFFQAGKATLLPQSYSELNRIAKFLKDNPNLRIEIAGHTDSQGSAEVNKVLSNDRALAVAYNLQGQQISSARVKAVGYGSAKPVAANTSETGRAQNRRVEFRVVSR